VAVSLDAAATSTTVPTEQANVMVARHLPLPTTPEQLLHAVFLSTDLLDMPVTRVLV